MEATTVKALREVAKGLNIVGRWDMTKAQLIEAIKNATPKETNDDANENKPEGNCNVTKGTDNYINRLEKGSIVAFKVKDGPTISGMFINWSNGSKAQAVIETKKGSRYSVAATNIVWVKTGSRWPSWVFNSFKEQKEEANGSR